MSHPLTAERWQHIERLYYAARELPPAERDSWLMAACRSDAEMRREVETLLAADEQATGFLDTPALQLEAQKLAAAQPPLPAPSFTSPLGTSSLGTSSLGQHFSHYKVLSHIGAGGMGEVYLALDESLERKVALKTLPAQFVADAARLQRFEREAKAVSALNHPNIITIYEIGTVATEAGETHFIATEFIEGVTLRERLTCGPLDLREALTITAQVAAALEAAHKTGIIHRDIKPENIMVRPDGLVKVLDFGLARFAEVHREKLPDVLAEADTLPAITPARAGGNSMTDAGAIMGTPRYMSPEQARGLKVDARTDIFSLGGILYEMVTGQPAFPGESVAEIFVALLHEAPQPLTQAMPAAPVALDTIICRALEKDRAQRFQSVSELAVALATLKHQVENASELAETRSLQADTANPQSARTQPAQVALTQHSQAVTLTPRSLALAAALLLCVAVAVGWISYRWFAPRSVSLPDAIIKPLIGLPGTKDHAAFSPDESRIAFAWDGGKKYTQVSPHDIYVKVLGVGDNPLRLTTAPEDDVMPTWSPDGRFVTFVRMANGRGEIYRVPAQGGKEERLGETVDGCSWSPDGTKLAFISVATAQEKSSVYLLTVETGERKRLTTPPPPLSDGFPVFSPDGKSVAFYRNFGITERDLFVAPVNGGAVKRITNEKTRINGLTWTADGGELVYAATRGTKRQLFRVAVAGGTPERLPLTGENPAYPTISRLTNKLAWTESLSDSNIYVFEGAGFAGRDGLGKFGLPKNLIAYPREDHSPEFSPDGQKIVFASGRAGGEDLWLCDADGGNAAQLTTQGGPTGTPHWSPDGKWLVFDSHTRGNADIYVMPAGGGPWRGLTTEPSSDTQAVWSPDGRWIYFKSNRSGRGELYQLPVEGGAAIQITKTGAFEGYPSPDGKLLYFSKGRGAYGLWTVPIEGGEENPVPELKDAGYWRSWGIVKEGIYFISKEPGSKETGTRQTIKFFSFASRRITPLVTVDREALWWQAGLALSPDGKRLLFAQMDYANDEIMLMENFR